MVYISFECAEIRSVEINDRSTVRYKWTTLDVQLRTLHSSKDALCLGHTVDRAVSIRHSTRHIQGRILRSTRWRRKFPWSAGQRCRSCTRA